MVLEAMRVWSSDVVSLERATPVGRFEIFEHTQQLDVKDCRLHVGRLKWHCHFDDTIKSQAAILEQIASSSTAIRLDAAAQKHFATDEDRAWHGMALCMND